MNNDVTAHVNVSALVDRYDSKGEEWWATYGPYIIYDATPGAKNVVLTQYHPLTFHLPGGSYTPDFLHILDTGALVMVEIKGSKQQKGYRDARSKLRAAAEMYRWLRWAEVRCDGKGAYELEWIGG